MAVEKLERVFIWKDKDLSDPNPDFTASEVVKFYANTYPEMTTANVSGPKIHEGRIQHTISNSYKPKG